MNRLNNQHHTFTANDGGGSADPTQKEKLLSNFMAPKSITLKVGAQVMLIKNMDESLVNGTIGVVKEFVDPSTYKDEILSDDKDKDKAKKKQPSGMVYPVVSFKCPGYTKDVMVTAEAFKVELPNGELVAQRQQVRTLTFLRLNAHNMEARVQLPLILAWAMSIHKSQGQTLDRVKVDLGKVFEKGKCAVFPPMTHSCSFLRSPIQGKHTSHFRVRHRSKGFKCSILTRVRYDLFRLKFSSRNHMNPDSLQFICV